MNSSVFFTLAGVLVVAGLVLWVMFRLHHDPSQLDVEKYRKKWLEIEQLVKKNDQRSCQFAIIEADKLLDCALRENGIKGDTMGERMRSAKDAWTSRDAVWSAHKLRNQIVHETEFEVGYDGARRALAGFKKGLKDMGAI